MKKRNFRKLFIVLLALGAFNSSLYSQNDSLSNDVFFMSLEELLNMEISVASKKGLTQRE